MKKTDVYQTVTNNILAAMENGIIPWKKPFKTSFSPIPINFSTGKVYRGINVFLLNLACLQFGYPKNAWLTFRQAKQMGGYVKKGQSSETILFLEIHSNKRENFISGRRIRINQEGVYRSDL